MTELKGTTVITHHFEAVLEVRTAGVRYRQALRRGVGQRVSALVVVVERMKGCVQCGARPVIYTGVGSRVLRPD